MILTYLVTTILGEKYIDTCGIVRGKPRVDLSVSLSAFVARSRGLIFLW